jgi:hypothetical protein
MKYILYFSNIEYFSGYDCRFEEGILVIPAEGTPTVLVGNEGMGYCMAIPYEINRVFYRNFSLQGQPRREEEKLDEILKAAGVKADSKVGVIGYKYFYSEYCLTDPKYTFDIPHYILEVIRSIVGYENTVNFTEAVTGLTITPSEANIEQGGQLALVTSLAGTLTPTPETATVPNTLSVAPDSVTYEIAATDGAEEDPAAVDLDPYETYIDRFGILHVGTTVPVDTVITVTATSTYNNGTDEPETATGTYTVIAPVAG